MSTYPAKYFGDVWMLAHVAVICHLFLQIFTVLDFWLFVIAVVLGKHLYIISGNTSNRGIKMTKSLKLIHLNLQNGISYFDCSLLQSLMRFVKRSFFRFSLNHSNLKPEITEPGVKNYHIKAKTPVDGYVTKNFSQPNLHTVIMIHQWWGLNKSITTTAQIFASKNIRVFVPDLYRSSAANSAQEAGHKMSNLNWPAALEDLANIKNHLSENQSKDISVLGFCMGGALTFAALASISGWKAGGVFYGIPDLNICRLDKIKSPTIAHFGSEDPLKGFSDKQSALKLKKDCEKGNYPIDVRVYEGASHAFCNQDSLYFNKSACQLAFSQTRKLFTK